MSPFTGEVGSGASSFASSPITLVGSLNPLGGNSYGDVWGEGDYAYLGTFGDTGVAIVDISDPTAPFLAAHYNPGGGFKEVKVQEGIGYFSGDRPTHIVDLSDPTNPTLLSTIEQAHNLFIDGDFLYTNGGQIWNVSDPTAPSSLVRRTKEDGLYSCPMWSRCFFVRRKIPP